MIPGDTNVGTGPKSEMSTVEEVKTAILIEELMGVKKKGFLTKDEFLKLGMWKSPRPKRTES